ncbi:dynamin family protein [Oerskovia flava]|uniref:dynamin family protein n=1 Tax=Oerskovia flava TaxID=2986422 RepID=UPI00223E9A57|nr:dynamin family protein [Oerskovia sp. JB1-3-2]
MTEPGPDDVPGPLVDALETLRARLGALRLPLEVPGVGPARHDQAHATDQLDDYLLPRLRARSAPLLVVVGGSTGAGKSTLVNSLLGEQVSAPGVLRPTTRAPVLVHHPLDARWFSTDRVLPGLARLSGDAGAPAGTPTGAHPGASASRALRLVASDALPQGLALVDAPDVDSVESANRELAAQLLGAADLWLFVTTAARYADAVPWELLQRAAERHAQVALVIDRIDPGADEVVGDLRRMMDENALHGAPLFALAESDLVDGLLPESVVGEVSAWLSALGSDAEARSRVALATRDGVVDDLVRRTVALASAADAQVQAEARLRAAVLRAYGQAAQDVDEATSDGAMLRGEVLARWQDFVGTGEFFRAVEQRVGKVRDAVGAFFRGKPAQAPQVERAIAHGLEAVVLDAADTAAEEVFAAWRADPAGAALLDGLELSRSSITLRDDVAAQIRGWQSDVLELVREQGAGKRGLARALSFGLNGLGVSVMVLVFASTGGITGAEIGIAGGTAVLAQKLLEAVFGDDAVRSLTRTARQQLADRVAAVLDAESARFTAQLDALATPPGAGESLAQAARAVADTARTERAGRPAVPGVRTGRHVARSLRGAAQWRPGQDTASEGAHAEAPRDPADTRPGFWRRLLGGRRRDESDASPAGSGTDGGPA